MAVSASPRPTDVFTIERAEQLKALGHPLRLRVLEMLGDEGNEPLTNRELAQKLNVDPGHLHFHVKMLLRAGLIERAEGGKGREKPYRAVASTVRVGPELLGSRLTGDLQAAMLNEVQAGFAKREEGQFRSAQVTGRVTPEQAIELIAELVEKAKDLEDPSVDALVITAFMHPPTARGAAGS
ncbi:MAG TPA: helix-turn-helix domain-containing protein [Gaiellaceae bacterium]|jgi:DNA-binding transcriptional ArsR family regulator